jgi:hypothetical protein
MSLLAIVNENASLIVSSGGVALGIYAVKKLISIERRFMKIQTLLGRCPLFKGVREECSDE